MIYWIFDMDETLYQSNGKFNYNFLKPNNELISLIKKLNGLKILFTNGTHQHANIVLDKMCLVSCFDLILDRNILNVLKPNPHAFLKLIKWCSITKNDTCYYFEDSIPNLIVGSSLGWQTILINPSNNSDNNSDDNPFNNNKIITFDFIENGKKVKKKATINYTFNNINNALKYLISKIQK
jgi:putative hydrolase of the HAD superfamily